MSASDAILVVGDWVSEHYLTTDASTQSFKAEVLARRKAWDAAEGDTARSRFMAARSDLLAGLARLDEDPSLSHDLGRDLQQILGYTAIGLLHDTHGPVTVVTRHHLPDVAGVAVVAAKPVESADDLLDNDTETLAQPWEPEEGDAVTSVARLLSTLFVDEAGPGYALVLAGRTALVAERERWAEGRYLSVDLQLVCERNDGTRAGEVDRALACLSAESLAPDAEGTVWWNGVLEESVKHTVGVSQDLREGVRLSIELIANEVVSRRRAAGLPPLPAEEAQPLAKQALRYLYRILFLLYAEASPELGVLPVGATEYDEGYSLDRLRELVQVPLTTPRAEHGTHLYDSMGVLFRLVDQGYQPGGDEDGLVDPLRFRSLRADLFRPEAVAHVDKVGLGNARLQQVLQHLLLSKEAKGRDRGFISYAELGINQLGAVYEGLMSYTGRFAETDLYEVAKNGDSVKGSWLVPVERAGAIFDKDFVRIEDPATGERKPVLHHEGGFVFRLAGRERQQSASYYTPEVLTRFTVGQALEELLDQDGHRTTAEDILSLTVCEPALGSGAFAIEAVRQLAAEHLKRRQEELGERIDPEAYPRELQRVKAYLALHNVYGVDLNATAVELAEVSLWLDTMVEGLHAPWFGLHLRRGNSLIGARKAVYTRKQVEDRSWLKAVPKRVVPGSTSPDEATAISGRIPHFLLPAEGWGAAADVGKEIKDLVPDAVKSLKTWRRSMTAKPTKKQVDRLVDMGQRVERLWQLAAKRLEIADEQTRRDLQLWNGNPKPKEAREGSSTAPTKVEEVAKQQSRNPTDRHVTREEIEASLADRDGAYRRLRLVMDAWCALWFWPLTEDPDAGGVAPPTQDQWYGALAQILGSAGSAKTARQGDDTFATVHTWDDLTTAEEVDRDFAGAAPVARVVDKHPWLDVCARVSSQQGFFHWSLEFTHVLDRDGFDLQVGNPPWVRPTSDVPALLAEGDPWWQLTLRPTQATIRDKQIETLNLPGIKGLVIDGTVDVVATAAFVGSPRMYPHLTGLQPDLYRCFMEQTWNHLSATGAVALIHPESHFTDEKAGVLRAATYRRLRRHWQFVNELTLFDIDHHVSFGVHVYGPRRSEPHFMMATSLYHPATVARSLDHDGSGPEPGLKDEAGQWDLRPHRNRVQHVDETTLKTWHALLENKAVPVMHARMVYTVNLASAAVLKTLAGCERLGSLDLEFSAGWHEKNDRTKGYFESEWGRPGSWDKVILQGPHFHVGNPFYKSPNSTMANNLDWSTVDLETLEPDAIPFTSYKPRGSAAKYDLGYTHWGEARELAARDYYRVAWRKMAANTGERTLISAVVPPGTAHIDGVLSASAPTATPCEFAEAVAIMSTLLADFVIRAAPKSNIRFSSVERLPLPHRGWVRDLLAFRALRLHCVTDAYSAFWEEALPDVVVDQWAGGLVYDGRPQLGDVAMSWTSRSPLRRASDRRQAMVEIDSIAGLALGLTADDLCTVYRTQFAVLYGYDRNTYLYDANGRLVPNSVLTVWRRKGVDMSDDERTATNPSGNTYTYELPFVTLDREADMRQAYNHFQRVLEERGGA